MSQILEYCLWKIKDIAVLKANEQNIYMLDPTYVTRTDSTSKAP
jgi:hypothetical protein